MLAPVGNDQPKEATIPQKKHTIEIIAELSTTLRKLLNTRIEERAGKMIKLEINMVPMILIPTTMVHAVSKAISML